MKNGFVIFFAAFIVLAGSWGAFVLVPQLQLGGAKQVAVLNSSETYPHDRPGEANQGLQIYRANGCAACHTEQVQQTGVVCDVVLTAPGKKNPATVSNLVATLKLNGLTEEQAESAAGQITEAGGKTETHIVATGPDISRGWGLRHSVAEDFLYDNPVQLGSVRIGPDLAGVGTRLPDANWQLRHLYAPQMVKGSLMPPFRYLFETKKISATPSPDALNLPKEFAPADGYEVVPKPEAKLLVAYLLSLHADVPLYDAPFTPPAVSTNAPAK